LAISFPIALILGYILNKLTTLTRASCLCDPATMNCAEICAVPLEADVIATLLFFAILFPVILFVVWVLEKLYSLITKKATK